MKVFFEALKIVLGKMLNVLVKCAIMIIVITLLVKITLYSVWLFFFLFFLSLFGIAVAAQMEEIKRERKY